MAKAFRVIRPFSEIRDSETVSIAEAWNVDEGAEARITGGFVMLDLIQHLEWQ